MEKVIVWPDTHIPDEDKRKVKIMMDIVKKWKPDKIVFLGDVFDLAAPGRFAQGTPEEWKSRVQVSTKEPGVRFLRQVREAAPKSEIHFFEGNHEKRLQDYIEKKAPAFDGLISIPKIFDFDNLGIHWYPYKNAPTKLIGDFYVHHGTFVSGQPGQSAKKEMEHYGVSGFSGHTHRIGSYQQATLDGRMLSWYECGHLSDISKMHYSQHFNWQHGFGYAYISGRKVFPFVTQFNGQQVMLDGQLFK